MPKGTGLGIPDLRAFLGVTDTFAVPSVSGIDDAQTIIEGMSTCVKKALALLSVTICDTSMSTLKTSCTDLNTGTHLNESKLTTLLFRFLGKSKGRTR